MENEQIILKYFNFMNLKQGSRFRFEYMLRSVASILFILLVSRCSNDISVSFDTESWKSDSYGCREQRIKIYKEIIEYQNEILGLTNKQIIRILGKPERNELYRRNQKFFIYYISPASKCSHPYDGEALFLFVRFNAVGLSQEVFVQGEPGFKDKASI